MNYLQELEQKFHYASRRSSEYNRKTNWERLVKAYCHRPYHNLQHIYQFIQDIDLLIPKYKLQIPSEDEKTRLYLAAFYHDIVNDPTAIDNEEKSLLRLFEDAGALTHEDCSVISCYILSTKNHRPFEIKFNDCFVDIDMRPFSFDFPDYMEYVSRVKEEYSYLYTEDQWRTGREKFLLNLLGSNKRIYHFLPPEFDRKAIANITEELKGYADD